ncbi:MULTISPECIES: ABC transporter [unclassified Microbacterium]|uniref:ABC transporter n=1 Tax=unclassified Microbacterium TaxID=2609290 RepID=UPI000EA985C2|nr:MULTISPECIES: ABC transporter [unclassified Microbacterium]MBT2483357.1 ABC transporter [Microbacterium sp. ISL-108]RKN66391.1 ABC transporter [Microbacterium sp. CGR2]
MSDPEGTKPEKPTDVDEVVGNANAGLDAAAAAGADVPGGTTEAPANKPVDPDLAAFEAAEREHPGLFSSPSPVDSSAPSSETRASGESDASPIFVAPVAGGAVSRDDSDRDNTDRDNTDRDSTARVDTVRDHSDRDSTDRDYANGAYVPPTARHHEDSGIADAAYASSADDTETRVVPSEPTWAPASQTPQPIFVQAPEPPRDRGNRGTAGAIGLLATLAFAILYLAATLGLGALAGDVTGENIGEALVAPLMTWGYWTPVVVFFLGFWLLGAIINRGRWGLWVVFGIIVGIIAYAGHILGQLFEAPFWELTPTEGLDLVGEQLLAPLAIAAFVFARELTIWFGAWVARSGARKTELNDEAQREYERTLEAGPTLAR